MARRAFERDPVFSAALAIQNAEHLRRIAGLGGKAQALHMLGQAERAGQFDASCALLVRRAAVP